MAFAKIGTEFLLGTTQPGPGIPGNCIADLGSGRFILTWTTFPDIRSQIFYANGTPAGDEFTVNLPIQTNWVEDSSVALLSDGGFVVTWTDHSGQADDFDDALRGQRFTVDGVKVGNQFRVNTETSNSQRDSNVAGLALGGFVAVWRDYSGTLGDASGSAIHGQLFDAAGAKVASEFLVNTATTNDQSGSSVTALVDGGFLVTWTDSSASPDDSSGRAVRGQMFHANGTRNGAEFLVNATTSGDQVGSKVTPLAGGGFVVTYSDGSASGGDTSLSAVQAQIFKPDGSHTEILVNTTTSLDQFGSQVAALPDGRFVVAWTDASATGGDNDRYAVRAQIITANGEKSGMEFLVNTITSANQQATSIAAMPDGTFVITWTDTSMTAPDTDNYAIRGQVFDASHYYGDATGETLIGGSFTDTVFGYGGDDTLRGEGGDDYLNGGDNADTVRGGDGADRLYGGTSNDFLYGDSGNDLLDGGSGVDGLTGGAGNDTYFVDNAADVVLEGASEGVSDVVSTSVSYTLSAGVFVEHLQAASIVGATPLDLTGNEIAQTLTGNDGINHIDGKGGADTMTGNGGNDIFIVDDAGDKVIEFSGGGADTVNASVSYTLGASSWIEVLQTTLASGSAAINLTGNNIGQGIIGNNGANKLSGLGGDDLLFGLKGNDTLTGGAGKDTFQFNTQLSSASNVDAITDFNPVDDTIKLAKSIFTTLTNGALSSEAFWKSTAGVAHDTSDRILYDTDSGALTYDADGNLAGGVGAIKFAVVGLNLGLTNADFTVA